PEAEGSRGAAKGPAVIDEVEPLHRDRRDAGLARIGAARRHDVIDALVVAGRDVLPERVDLPACVSLMDGPGHLGIGGAGEVGAKYDETSRTHRHGRGL